MAAVVEGWGGAKGCAVAEWGLTGCAVAEWG